MKAFQVSLDEKEAEWIEKKSKDEDISVSYLVRKLIDDAVEGK